jgi:hypothetical protein
MLVCALAVSAYAGDIPCPGVTSDPPPSEETMTEAQSEADITITEALLTLIEIVLLP